MFLAGAQGAPAVACPAWAAVFVTGDDGLPGGEVFDGGDFIFAIFMEAIDLKGVADGCGEAHFLGVGPGASFDFDLDAFTGFNQDHDGVIDDDGASVGCPFARGCLRVGGPGAIIVISGEPIAKPLLVIAAVVAVAEVIIFGFTLATNTVLRISFGAIELLVFFPMVIAGCCFAGCHH